MPASPIAPPLGPPLGASWFAERDVLRLARDLVGKVLVHETDEGTCAGRIVENRGAFAETLRAYLNR